MTRRSIVTKFLVALSVACATNTTMAAEDSKLECVRLKISLESLWELQSQKEKDFRDLVNLVSTQYNGLFPKEFKNEVHKSLFERYTRYGQEEFKLEQENLIHRVKILIMSGVDKEESRRHGFWLSPQGVKILSEKYESILGSPEYNDARRALQVIKVVPNNNPTRIEKFCQAYGVRWR